MSCSYCFLVGSTWLLFFALLFCGHYFYDTTDRCKNVEKEIKLGSRFSNVHGAVSFLTTYLIKTHVFGKF